MNDDVVYTDTELDAEPEVVWEEVVTGDWLGGDTYIPLVEGQEGHVDDGDGLKVLVVEEVVVERRLVFRWASFSEPPSRVVIELEPIDGGTRVTVTERPLVPMMRAMAVCG